MKKVSAFLFIILMTSCAQNDLKKVVSSYPNGSDKEVHTISGKSGDVIKEELFLENGQLAITYEIDPNDDSIKKMAEFHPSGAVKLEGKLKNDHRFEVWKAYFPSGELQSIANYDENGKEEGLYKVYRLEGATHYLSYSGYYSGGERRGTWNFYNKDGVVINTKEFKKIQ